MSEQVKSKKWTSWLIRAAAYGLFLFFLVTLLLSLIIQIPAVQNWVVRDFSKRISRDLGTEVQIEKVRLHFFDDLLIRNLLVRDLQGDTLLFAKEANFDLELPLIGLLEGALKLQSIELLDASCYLKTRHQTNNYQFLLDYLNNPKPIDSTNDVQKKSFVPVFDPLRITLHNIHFIHDSQRGGLYSDIFFPQISARLEMKKPGDPLLITTLDFEKPGFTFEKINLPLTDSITQISHNKEANTSERPGLLLLIKNMAINGGTLKYQNKSGNPGSTSQSVLNLANLHMGELNVAANDFIWQNGEGGFTLDQLSFETPQGFILEKISSDYIRLCEGEIQLENLVVNTPESLLSGDLSLKYDLPANENGSALSFDLHLNRSMIALKDLLYFSESLNGNEFFILNGGRTLEITGDFRGYPNNFSGRNLDLNLADRIDLFGHLQLRDLFTREKTFLNLDLVESSLDVNTIRQLFNGLEISSQYDLLGQLHFKGVFAGFLNDFDARGDLQTELGDITADVHMQWPERNFSQVKYQGKIEMIQFDLEKWLNSKAFGNTSLVAEISEGTGIDLETARADVNMKVSNFIYKGYSYKNAVLRGELKNRFFDGAFYISEPNLTFDFNGHIDFTGAHPLFDFDASVEYMNFRALNLSEKQLELSGDFDFDFVYHDLYNLDGSVLAYDLKIVNDSITHQLDSIRLVYDLNDGRNKNLRAQSDFFNFHLLGNFDLQRLPGSIRTLIHRKHPLLAEKFNIGAVLPDSLYTVQNFHFNATLKDSRGLQKIWNSALADFQDVVMNGYFTSDSLERFRYRMDLFAPFIEISNNKINDVALDFRGENSRSAWDIYASEIEMGNTKWKSTTIRTNIASDSLQFDIKSESFARIFSNIDLQGQFYLSDTVFRIDLANSSFDLLKEHWTVGPDNYLELGDHLLHTDNMIFRSGESFIKVHGPGDRSLTLEVARLDFSFFDELLNENALDFEGSFNGSLYLSDIFSKSPAVLNLRVDSLQINRDDFGTLYLESLFPDLSSTGMLRFEVNHGSQRLSALGPLLLPLYETNDKSLFFDLDCQLQNYPLKIGEYFIGGAISQTTGTINSRFRFFMDGKKPAISGDALLNGSLKVNYLGSVYKMTDQKATLSSEIFDLTGAIIVDELGNEAEVTGGIIHNNFKKFGLNATIASDYFQFLNTTRQDNDIYYGSGVGSGSIQFTGNFKQTNLRIRARTGPQTKLFIPIEEDYTSDGDYFLHFVIEKDTNQQLPSSVNLTGINLDMQLSVTPDAEMQIIFDEVSGDIIRGTGSGNLTLTKERTGDLQMNGRYIIDQGQYLYTLLNFINKPFIIDRGGQITWNGDPLNADLQIQARYTGLKTPPRNLIAEFIQGRAGNEAAAADISTQVDVVLFLRGILSAPEINFDIRFPDLDPALRNYIDSKMRILAEDVSELNRQIYGLLIFNSFLPSTISLDLTATTVNTLSEFITSQLSNYVAAYISQGVEDVDYISGVDFYFDYNYFRSEDFIQGQETGVKTGSEFALAPNIRFFDDRLAFSPGASVIQGSVIQGSAFIGTDVKLDFFVTEDKRLRVSLFYKRIPSLQGGRNKLGLGFRFSRSYDTFGDIFKKHRRPAEEIGPGVEVEIHRQGN